MRRRLVAILTGLSLLLCVLTCVAWGLSYRWWAEADAAWIWVERGDGKPVRFAFCRAGSEWGQLALYAKSSDTASWNPEAAGDLAARARESPWHGEWSGKLGSVRYKGRYWGLLAFDYDFQDFNPRIDHRSWYVSFPHWCPALLFAALPTVRLISRSRRRKRARGNVCEGCGYDLRASPQRCPECGRDVSPQASKLMTPSA